MFDQPGENLLKGQSVQGVVWLLLAHNGCPLMYVAVSLFGSVGRDKALIKNVN